MSPALNKIDRLTEPGSGAVVSAVHELSEAGRYGEALALVSAELARRTDDAELLLARASVWFDWGRFREAHAGFIQAEAAGMTRVALHLNLAWSCHLLRRADEAERHARRAVAVDPDNAAAQFGLGAVMQRLRNYAEAIACFERTLQLAPDHVQATAGIAQCKLEQHDYVASEAWMRRAVELAPESPQLLINLGVAMVNQGRYAESLEVLGRAAAVEEANGMPPMSMIDTGFALVLTGRYHEALDVFRKGLPQIPDPRAHGYYAFLLLAMGWLREGWAQYEFRWMQEPHLSRRPTFPQPPWVGQELDGKTILLMSEQGAGDIIHFARFAAPLKAMGASVVMQMRPELVQLAQGFEGVDRVVAIPDLPAAFDYYIALMGIPHVLGTELATIPADVPYLRVDPIKERHWAARIKREGLKVGLAWAGNPKYPRDHFRSIAFDKLGELWDVQGVSYHSLQRPLKPGEFERFPTQTTLVNLDPELSDFADTAAAIAQLDLVICVDTAIAHLAGALGKPVWLMLPEIGDFRWLDGREDSPWYPSARLFRQRQLGEWSEVVARVAAQLRQVVTSGAIIDSTAPAGVVATKKVDRDDTSGNQHPDVRSCVPKDIALVTETRHGILQYFPEADAAARSVAWYGEYLQPQLDLLSRLVPAGAHVVEAGSGVGEHAIALARMLGAEGHLLVYEAREVLKQVLRQNLDVNRVAGNVTQMRRELGAPRDLPTQQADPETSTVDTVDALHLERLDLLKIRHDANAAEILDGAGESLWRLRPVLFIAARDEATLSGLADRVKEFGYRCWRMATPLFNPDNYHRRNADIFDAGTSLALLGIPEEVELTAAIEDGVAQSGCAELS